MVRETMGWYRCDICGRKGRFFSCRLGARTLSICPFCLVTLYGVIPLRCGQDARELLERISSAGPVRGSGDLADRVRERLAASRSRASRR